MGKSISDIRRREVGTKLKEERRHLKSEQDESELMSLKPIGGCPWYDNEEMMMIYCPKCKTKDECY